VISIFRFELMARYSLDSDSRTEKLKAFFVVARTFFFYYNVQSFHIATRIKHLPISTKAQLRTHHERNYAA
jgi:hypothetical protein